MPPPLNVLAVPFVPIFLCLMNKPNALVKLNKVAVQIFFFPLACLYALFFATMNIIAVPIAYMVSLISKISTVAKHYCSKETETPDLSPSSTPGDLLLFFFLGIPFLAISQFVDLYFFVEHLY
jgi:hypothetical protein